MNIDIARIARKAATAASYLDAVKSGAITLAANPSTSSKQWGEFAVKVAVAEGNASAWARLAAIASKNGNELTQADANEVALSLLSNGADDSWSGRGNDVARARFDGVRSACTDMQWL